MSWVEPRDAWLLVIGARTARLFAAGADAPIGSVELTAARDGSLDSAALAGLLAQAPRTSRARLQTVISDLWLAAAELPWSQALLDAKDASEYARGQFELAGFSAADFDIAIDDPPQRAMRVACGVSRGVVEGLAAQAAAHGFVLDGLVPLSACVIAARQDVLPAARALVGVAEAGAVSLASVLGGRVQTVVSRSHDGDALAVLEGLWRRHRLRDAASAALTQLYVIDTGASAPTAGVHVVSLASCTPGELALAARRAGALDFVRRPRAPRTWQWAAAAVLALAGLGLGWQARQVRSDLSASQAQLQALRAMPVKARRPEGAARRAQKDELRIARMQWSALELPLDELFAAVRPPADVRAALLSVELAAPRLRANSSTVRLSGEARDSEAMTLYLAHLGSTRPFVGAELTHHETLGARAGGAHRFTMEATWAR